MTTVPRRGRTFNRDGREPEPPVHNRVRHHLIATVTTDRVRASQLVLLAATTRLDLAASCRRWPCASFDGDLGIVATVLRGSAAVYGVADIWALWRLRRQLGLRSEPLRLLLAELDRMAAIIDERDVEDALRLLRPARRGAAA